MRPYLIWEISQWAYQSYHYFLIYFEKIFHLGGKFQQYDYGWTMNIYHYNQPIPPVYNISKLEVFTALYYSNLDNFAPNYVSSPQFISSKFPENLETHEIEVLMNYFLITLHHLVLCLKCWIFQTVVPFARLFGGPVYECQIEDVCHTFVLFDHRVGPFMVNARKVLDEITRDNSKHHTKRLMFEKSNHENKIFKCHVHT